MFKIKFNDNRLRLYLILIGVLFLASFFTYRLFDLQIVRGETLRTRANNQFQGTIRPHFNRGSIFFTTLEGDLLPAAILQQNFSIIIDPRLIKQPAMVYDLLDNVLDIDEEFFNDRAGRKETAYQLIAQDLTEEEAEAVKNLNIRGVSVRADKKRHYPAGRTASHVLGLIGYDGYNLEGRYGLEKAFNHILTHEQSGTFSSFFAEIFFGWQKDKEKPSDNQGDLVLTIEPTVQRRLEKEMRETVEKFQAKNAGAVIMDPRDGKILGMMAWPDFNPGESQSDLAVLSNPLVERVFEMGSVFKPLTMVAGFDAGVVSPETTYYDAGSIVLDGFRIHNYDKKSRGTVDMQKIIDDSLNTGVVFIMQQLGREVFREYMYNFGLGETTGIELPNEVKSLVSNLQSPRQVEYATVSFGQGIAVTPLALTRAFATLANGGFLITPYIIEKINYRDGREELLDRPSPIRVLSDKATEEITQILVNAFDSALLGGKYKMTNYSIATKTGTAQIAQTTGRGYEESRNLHSFFGYYPAYEPQFLVFMYLIEPQGEGVRFASDTLVEPFVSLADFLLSYYEVPPDRGLVNNQ
ncbi:MAG: peptidoglycan D,D-transpeptidase FtsI family protein [Patescibacteria group bacterium]